jgi:hypothetical protein
VGRTDNLLFLASFLLLAVLPLSLRKGFAFSVRLLINPAARPAEPEIQIRCNAKEASMKRYALSLVLCLLIANVAFAQTKPSVEGVWKVAETIPPGTTAQDKSTNTTNSNTEIGLLIFTKGYYSGMGVEGREARGRVRPPIDPKNLTDAEKIERYEQWKSFVANAGTYEIKESTISMRATVAKNPNRVDKANTWEFKLEGTNTLWLIPTGDRVTTDPRVKLTRLE